MLLVLVSVGVCAVMLRERWDLGWPQALVLTTILPLGVWVLAHLLGLDRGSRLRRKLGGLRPDDLDKLSGEAFEEWVAAILEADGLNVRTTRRTRDYGIDLVVQRGGRSLGIEVKRHKKPIGNRVVRSLLGGCASYGCDLGAIVTQSSFTPAARAQAASSDVPVLLADRNDLEHLPRLVREFLKR